MSEEAETNIRRKTTQMGGLDLYISEREILASMKEPSSEQSVAAVQNC